MTDILENRNGKIIIKVIETTVLDNEGNASDAFGFYVKYESGKADTDGAKTDTALAAGAEVSYVVNDKIGAFFDIMYVNADLDDDDSGSVTGAASKIQVRPGVVFTAGKNATITAAFQYDSYNDSDDRATKTEYSIPVIFRVKL